ncbi:MFS transporter [Hydrogenophaga sp. PAMC20947]|uniref:MFS transporter n=1 Tax=Hydrogenophaga sp. PAMC20947 TaxID=2565558 RepID=UPI00109DC2E5|nr:MFS transporter [Hydrogenophaga sp. PAMC20947]QCB47374.1 MFS transporter [Hydrogenophaga sp. PAMC20947]
MKQREDFSIVAAERLGRRTAMNVFLTFALAYLISALLRAITATLSPILSAELELGASDLGLLAGGYFFGFALMQLPLGTWLDAYGPRRVSVAFLSLAVLGCVAFALATSFPGLLVARVLIGMGVSACLMAPLTGYRRWLTPAALLRANSWMLMTGSMGMVAATLPVQWLVPLVGWRGLFWGLAGLIAVSMALLAWQVPAWRRPAHVPDVPQVGYRQVAKHPYFRQMVAIGFFNYGGMVAVQTLWAAPWMVRVAGYSPQESAGGLFAINVCMLAAFWTWGMVNPHLVHRGVAPERLIFWGLPISLVVLACIVTMGPAAGWPMWALFCVSSTVVSLCQPAVAQALPPETAGRAMSAFNLVIFVGIFVVQWGIGLLVDAGEALGWDTVASFRAAIGVFGLLAAGAYAGFWRGQRRALLKAALP